MKSVLVPASAISGHRRTQLVSASPEPNYGHEIATTDVSGSLPLAKGEGRGGGAGSDRCRPTTLPQPGPHPCPSPSQGEGSKGQRRCLGMMASISADQRNQRKKILQVPSGTRSSGREWQ